MSEENVTLDMSQVLEAQHQNDEVHRKEQEVYEHNINVKHDNVQRIKDELEKQKSFDLTTPNVEYIQKMVKDNDEYMELAKNSQVFLDNDDFQGVIPFFAKNIILIGAKSGDGKSTTCANISYSMLRKGKKVLVISNEEVASDVYNRVTCLIEGWPYVDHSKFTKEQKAKFSENIPKLAERLTVIDDSWGGGIGMTTTIEGVNIIINHLIEIAASKGIVYDAIVWDYYQNVSRSTNDPSASMYDIQERYAAAMDGFKNVYPGVNVVLAQIKPEESSESFQYRLQGRKIIYEKATCVIEAVAEREKFATSWTVHKSRWSDKLGKTCWTGYDKGKYVKFTTDFEVSAQSNAIAIGSQELNAKANRDRAARVKAKGISGPSDEAND